MKETGNDFMIFSLLSQTLKVVKLAYKSIFRLSIFSLILPGAFLGLYLRVNSHSAVSTIRDLTNQMIQGSRSKDYFAILYSTKPFFFLALLGGIIFFVLFVTAYIATTFVALEKLGYYKIKYNSLKELFWVSFKRAFPKAYIIIAVSLFIGNDFGFMRVFGLFLLVGTILMLVDGKGSFSSLWHAITLKYASGEVGLRIRVFLSISCVVAI